MNKLDDLSMPLYTSKKENKEQRVLCADRFLEEYFNKPESDLLTQFNKLHEEGVRPQKEYLFVLTEKVFTLLNFSTVHRDLPKKTMTFKNTAGNQELYITYSVDQKSDFISLTAHQYSNNKIIEMNTYISKDILSYLTNQINSNLSMLTIDYGSKTKAIQSQTSTIGQLDENYVCWLILNIDAVTIATLETNAAYYQMYQSGNGPNESMIASEKCKNNIKQRIESNKQNLELFLSYVIE